MIQYNILPIVYNLQRLPSQKNNILDGFIKGQQISANNQLFINQCNIEKFPVWNLIDDNIIFKTGNSILLGNNMSQVIYHNLNKLPNFFNLTLLNINTDNNIGDIYITYFDNNKITIANNGNDKCNFCWFII